VIQPSRAEISTTLAPIALWWATSGGGLKIRWNSFSSADSKREWEVPGACSPIPQRKSKWTLTALGRGLLSRCASDLPQVLPLPDEVDYPGILRPTGGEVRRALRGWADLQPSEY